jgi:methyltransferase (TIGR00027 family)
VRSGPSLTARAVALARSELERPRTPAGEPDAEQRLYASLSMPARWPIGRGLRRWVAARTTFFDEVTLAAIRAGVSQIVIVGAGYDGRSLRFHEPGLRFFEVDHPSTQQDKRWRVEHFAKASGPPSVYVAHDLTNGGLCRALERAGHEAGQPTLFICEGLLLYLTPQHAEELIIDMASCAAPPSRLALSARERVPHAPLIGRISRAAQRLLLAAIGEPRRSLFEPGELAQLLARGGWRTVREDARVGTHGGSRGTLVLSEPLGG